ncbi:MAG TPA: hypothetical protein VN903_30800, partial [Polyangia bacterium]|nr:hypothetical protein [Polyangia bacterium]
MNGNARRVGLVASLGMMLYACGSSPASKGDGSPDAPALDGGTAGATGAAGTTGIAGATGAAGTTGVAGAPGAGGTTGASGTSGVAGAGGTSGASGTGGTGGASGGTTGVAGTSGTGGRGGATGAAGASGTTGVAGASGTGGTTVPACTGGGAPAVLDTSPFAGALVPGALNSTNADRLAISADGWVHLFGTEIFSAPDDVMFRQGDPRNVTGPFAIDAVNNWIYAARADAAQKWSVWRYPTSGGCLSKVYDFPVDVETPRPV